MNDPVYGDLLVELPDGSFIQKKFEDLVDTDMIIFDGPDAFQELEYAQQKLQQDFDDLTGIGRFLTFLRGGK